MNIWGLGGRIVGVLPKPRPALKDPITWVAVIGAVYVLYGAWTFVSGTDFYLRALDPEQYWAKKVSKYQSKIDFHQRTILADEIHMEMLQVMKPYVLAREKVWNPSPEELQKEETDMNEHIQFNKRSIGHSQNEISLYKQKLIRASDELSQYR